ncbi:DUF1641 domain-containing protein [Oxyplasma meridianum]|uniref:DUF1641 domain-containing protein n=1 Tax=Oxyplasma meridianum TaxID=3073602 RepID=A0AAX4NDT0_9ARCH
MAKQLNYVQEDEKFVSDSAKEKDKTEYETTMLFIRSLMEHREAVFSVLTEIMQTEKNQNLVNNFGSIYKFLSNMDSSWLSETLERSASKIKEIPDTDRNVTGMMGLLKIIKDPEINTGLKVALKLLSVLAPHGEDEK